MLFNLHIKNIALLDDVEIEFHNGLNVLTGETGAGKSILIGSINLLLGDRANRELIRHGADRAEVIGLFYIENEDLKKQLAVLGYEIDDEGAIALSRQLLRDGKNLCRIGGRPATLSELKEVSQLLVNIHGQHDNQALLNPTSHIHFLDSFLKKDGAKTLLTYQADYNAWRSLLQEAEALQMDEAERLRKIDILTFECDEIRAANLSADEEDDLKQKRDIIRHRVLLEQSIGQALSALCDGNDEADARQALSVTAKALDEASGLDSQLEPFSNTIYAILEETEELARNLRHYFDSLSDIELPLDEIEARLDVIYHLKRKYGGSVEAVLAHLEACEKELFELQNAEEKKEEMEQLLSEAEKKANLSAQKLTVLRQKAIPLIQKAVDDSLHFLNMPDAEFIIELTPAPLHRYGAEQIHFKMKTNAGEDYRPLTKIISGGELSRIMLAIKSILTDGDSVETLIFDEIDTGVSGSAAQKIGLKMKSLAKNKQVFCVTHLAQIAAMANTHFYISKITEEGRTKTDITPLAYNSRVRELARIIGGDSVSETTLKQAEELIAFGENND
ncbi:MAG: DNA repair protein RecN [Ruminococcaceae bacterium]|nr:DNA repair protein RecN [Oscillospiraceae bacterium]